MEKMNHNNLSEVNRERIIGLFKSGLYTRVEIARVVGCTRQTVSFWIKKYQEGELDALCDKRKNNSGRPKKTTIKQDDKIIGCVF